MKPNKQNFCGGNFSGWLEIMLTPKCNGRCSWCVDKEGYHPDEKATCDELIKMIRKTGKKNIILLGGEPTLYSDLKKLIKSLPGLNVYITTNGSKLTPDFVINDIRGIKGLNISIHDYDLNKNREITGINLDSRNLKKCICLLGETTIRINCNLIKGYIDSRCEIETFIEFAKSLGADSIRFAELKNDEDNFINLHSIYGDKYGINNEPFGLGCNTNVRINGMPVNFRQMCGFQTPFRIKPVNPEFEQSKQVLYYDGKLYKGWQKELKMETKKEVLEIALSEYFKKNMKKSTFIKICKSIDVDADECIKSAREKLKTKEKDNFTVVSRIAEDVAEECGMGGGCQY